MSGQVWPLFGPIDTTADDGLCAQRNFRDLECPQKWMVETAQRCVLARDRLVDHAIGNQSLGDCNGERTGEVAIAHARVLEMTAATGIAQTLNGKQWSDGGERFDGGRHLC